MHFSYYHHHHHHFFLGLYDIENFIDIYNITKLNHNNNKKKKLLKPSVLSYEDQKNPHDKNKFPIRPLILLPSEIEFLLNYLAKDDKNEMINYDNEEDLSLLENDANVS